MKRLAWLGAMMAVAPAGALAQAPMSKFDPTQVIAKPPTPTPKLTPPAAPASSVEDAAPRFFFARAQFEGAHALTAAALAPAWTGLAGKTVSLADLRTIAARAERIYAGHGYGFVAVVVTPQRIEAGVVRFKVIEGRISDLSVIAADPAARRQATAAFRPLVGMSPPATAPLEGAFVRAQAVPGLAVAGALRRGTGEGGLDLVVQAKREEWRTYANLNNLYPNAVGPMGALFGVDHFGSSIYGDALSAQIYNSLEGGNQTIARVSYERGLTASGLAVTITGFGAWADPQADPQAPVFATQVGAGRIALSQPLIARFAGTLAATVAFDISHQTTKVFGREELSDDDLRILSLNLGGEWRPGGWRLNYSAELRQGLAILGASRQGQGDLSRLNADPQATVGRFGLEVETPAVHTLRLDVRSIAQAASAPLTEPEQYAVGDLSIGRGYQPGANYGDEALGAATELRLGPYRATRSIGVAPFAFFDGVQVWHEDRLAGAGHFLASAGAGIRVQMPNQLSAELTFAQPLRPSLGLGEKTPSSQILLNVTVGLNSAFSALAHGFQPRPAS